MRATRTGAGRGGKAVVPWVVAAGFALGCGGGLAAQAEDGDFKHDIPVAVLMDAILMPTAQVVWDAVAYEVSKDGEKVTGPKTDDDWQKLRWSAVQLAESANNLVVPGRAANVPDAVAGEGELEPAEIQRLMESQRPAWVAHAQALYAAAQDAIRAVDARDAEQVSNAGGAIDAACEGCHLQFWYPEQ
jgi:cytochrome c556